MCLGNRDTKMNETWLLDIRILQSDRGDRKKKFNLIQRGKCSASTRIKVGEHRGGD